MIRSLVYSIVLAFFLLHGCTDDVTSPSDSVPLNSVRINGGGFTDWLLEDEDSTMIAFQSADTAVVVLFAHFGTDSVCGVVLTIPNVKVGSYNVSGKSASTMIVWTDKHDGYDRWNTRSGKIIISSWAGIGGRAKGTFEGTLEHVDQPGSTMTVTGSFEDPLIWGM